MAVFTVGRGSKLGRGGDTIGRPAPVTYNETGRSALVELTADVSEVFVGAYIRRIQDDVTADSGSSWEASLPVAPTAGNLLVVACVAGRVLSIDGDETTWNYAQGAEKDNMAIWYKIADGDATDNNVGFSTNGSDQYGWVMAEYECVNGWQPEPFDQSAYDGVHSSHDDEISSGTTPTTTQVIELGFAVFRMRDDDAAISGDALTNNFTKFASEGTEFGEIWSMEIYAADNNDIDTFQTVETTLSWTSGTCRNRGGVVATFKPGLTVYDESGRSALFELDAQQSDQLTWTETGAATVELTTSGRDRYIPEGTYNETWRSARVDFTTSSTAGYVIAESASATVDLTAVTTEYDIPVLDPGPGSVVGAPSAPPSATGAPGGVPSAATTIGSPSVTGGGGPPGVGGADGPPSAIGPSGIPSVNYDEDN